MEIFGLLFSLIMGFILAILLYRELRNRTHYSPGQEEELIVDSTLKSIFTDINSYCHHDVMFDINGYTTQIDHILVTSKAIYVIETKDYSGWIFGSERNQYWTQTFTHYKSRTSGNNYTKSGVSKYKFYNPIKQNATHVRVVRRLLNLPGNIPVVNVIVFGNNATLKNIEYSVENIVTSTPYLETAIKYKEGTLNPIITQEQRDYINRIIYEKNITDYEKRQQHIQRIANKYKH